MKKIIFILLASLLLASCRKSTEDVRKVKIGISANELKYIMGEPHTIRVQNGLEEWFYSYSGGTFGKTNGLSVEIKSDKVTNFESY